MKLNNVWLQTLKQFLRDFHITVIFNTWTKIGDPLPTPKLIIVLKEKKIKTFSKVCIYDRHID